MEGELAAAVDHTSGEPVSSRPVQTVFNAGISQGVHQDINECRPATANGAYNAELAFWNSDDLP